MTGNGITVRYLLQKVFTETTLGYIKVMFVDEKQQGSERDLISLTALQLHELLDVEVKEYYKIGSYWHVVL